MTTTLALYAPIVVPVLFGAAAPVLRWRVAAAGGVAAAVTILASGVVLAAHTTTAAHAAGPVRADALSAWMLITVGAVATVAAAATPAYLRPLNARQQRRHVALTQAFLACMSLAVLADNLGLLWIAVEATTIVTAFLVGYRRTRHSVEAAWKYVVLCSVGVAIAFLGTVCVYAAAVAAGGHGVGALDWTYLSARADGLDHDVMRLAAGLVLLGFGTKAGLAPMHAWLPDAHSQAPAPVSALMSGVLLAVAFYAILRYKAVVDAVLGPGYSRALLLVAALASLAVAATLLVAQRDYKRLLAYSSIEHMGLIALGTAFGVTAAVTAALLHMLGHGIAKAVAFCAAGRILRLTGSLRIAAVGGLIAGQPALAATFGVSLVVLLGLPPFSLFASELGLARAGFAAGYGWAVAIAFTLVLVAFAAIIRHAAGMLLGPTGSSAPTAGEDTHTSGVTVLASGLFVTAVLGVYLGPLAPVLAAAATIVTTGQP